MGKLDGKVAMVTGAARGLGRAYAKRLAGLGAKVAVADLNLHSYEEFEVEAKDRVRSPRLRQRAVSPWELKSMSAIARRSRQRCRGSSRNGAGSMCSSRMRVQVAVGRSIQRPVPSIQRSCS